MKIYLIRHCESEDDILDCYGGCADFDLTEKGIATAKAYAKELTNLKIEKIFTSPYKRAKNVANIFNDQLHCGVEIIDDLREMNTYGVMSGVNKELAKKIFSLLLNSEKYKRRLEEEVYKPSKGYEGVFQIRLENLRNFEIPFIPIEQQKEIIKKEQMKLDKINRLKEEINELYDL